MAGDIPDVYMRFEGFEGECQDLQHPGEKGWITIKNFTFGFGFPGADAAAQETDDGDDSQTTSQPGTKPGQKPATKNKKKKKKKSQGMTSGPMTFDCITFSKGSDVMSKKLMEACHSGNEIPMVELQACRYGGAKHEEKLTFLHLIFEKVHLKT